MQNYATFVTSMSSLVTFGPTNSLECVTIVVGQFLEQIEPKHVLYGVGQNFEISKLFTHVTCAG